MKTLPGLNRNTRARSAGVVLVDLICATALIVIALGAALVTFIGVQRSLATSLYQVNAQGDQNRVFAYLRRDLRGASSAQVTSQGTEITITLPRQTSPTFNLNLGPSLLSLLQGTPSAGASDTVRYYRQGTSIIREWDGAPTELSSSATLFQVSVNGSLVEIDAAFQPRYSLANRPTNTSATTFTGYVYLLNATAP